MLISVEIPDDVKAQLDETKARTGMSLSLIVRRMVELHLESGTPVPFALTRQAP